MSFKHLLIAFLFLLTGSTIVAAQPPLGANGYPLGWNARFDARWRRIKDDPSYQHYWAKLPDQYKYYITGNSAYLTPVEKLIRNFCGRRPFLLYADQTTNTFTLNLMQRMYFNVKAIEKTENGDPIKFTGTSLPGGIDPETTYYVVNKTKHVIVTGVSSRNRSYSLEDSSKDFRTLGLQRGDLIEKVADKTAACFPGTASSYITNSRLKVACDDITDLRAEYGYGTGSSYQIVRYTFQVAATPNGAPIDLQSDPSDDLAFYDANEGYYRPDTCVEPDANSVRAHHNEIAKQYAIFKVGYTPEERKIVRTVLDRMADISLIESPPSWSDSDELAGAYFSTYIHSFAIEDEDPARAKELRSFRIVGPLQAGTPARGTADNETSNWRNTLEYIWQDLIGGGGTDNISYYIEGSHYNILSLHDILQDIDTITAWTGTNYFTSFTSKTPELLEMIKAEFTPDVEHVFQVGDVQDRYQTRPYYNIDRLATFADYLNGALDAEAWYLFDRMGSFWGWTKSTTLGSPYWDPYAKRVTQAEWEARGARTYNDSTRAIAQISTGNKPALDSIFFTTAWKRTGFDHDIDANNIMLWRRGEWMIDYPRGYYSTVYSASSTALVPFGAFGVKGVGQIGFKKGPGWMYQAGTSVGNTQYTGRVPELVEELTRSTVYRRLADQTDLVILFDRIDVKNDPSLETYDAINNGKKYFGVPGNILEFSDYGISSHQNRAPWKFLINGFRHQLQFFLPAEPFATTRNSWSWYGNALPLADGNLNYKQGQQTAKLTVFIDDDKFSSGVYNNKDEYDCEYNWAGTATGVELNKLVDGAGNFLKRGINIGAIAENHTTGKTTTVTALDGATRISLAANIFGLGDKYSIHSAYPCVDLDNSSVTYMHSLRIAPERIFGMSSLMSVIHARSNTDAPLELTRLESTTVTDKAKGVLVEGPERLVYVFNATEGVAPENVDAPDVHLALNKKRRFQNGFDIGLKTNKEVNVFIFDLDPTKTWLFEINGQKAATIVPDDQGIANFVVPASAAVSEHRLRVATSMQCTATDWRGCIQNNCAALGWFWYDGMCNETAEEQAPACADSWEACQTQQTCEAADWYWYDSACHEEADVVESPPPAEDPGVTWRNVTGVEISGTVLRKTQWDGWGNGGAFSAESIAGDGVLEFTLESVNDNSVIVGLSKADVNASYNTVNYGLYIYTGNLSVYENGVGRGGYLGNCLPGDKLSIERVGTTIVYKKNGHVLFTSPTPSSDRLYADVAIYRSRGNVSNARMINADVSPTPTPSPSPSPVPIAASISTPDGGGTLGASATFQRTQGIGVSAYRLMVGTAAGTGDLYNQPMTETSATVAIPQTGQSIYVRLISTINGTEQHRDYVYKTAAPVVTGTSPVTWINAVGSVVSGNAVTKTAPDGWGNGGAYSMQSITGDGGIEFEASKIIGNVVICGLSSSDIDQGYRSVNYGVYFHNGNLGIYENGIGRAGYVGSYLPGDKLRVERKGSVVQYKKNGVVLFQSPMPSAGVLHADTAIYRKDGVIVNAVLFGSVQ